MMNDVNAENDDRHGTPAAVGLEMKLEVSMASLAGEEVQHKKHRGSE